MANVLASLGDLERNARLSKVQKNLFHLATEYLGYTLLTLDFHKPMLDDWDRRRIRRARGEWTVDELELWFRDGYKTTCRIAQMIQDFACNPNATIMTTHAVDEKAGEVVEEVAHHLQHNEALRRIFPPGLLPSKNATRFLTKSPSPQFTLNRSVYDRHPSLRGKGAGSEITGGHCLIHYADDIIGLNTVRDNGMPALRSWWGMTVKNVVRTGVGYNLATGTRWDPGDLYNDWLKNKKRWSVRVRACYETDGVPDWRGKPVLYTRDQIEAKRDGMSEWEFAAQMMNDPIPASERLWTADCEIRVTPREVTHAGRIFVLSDPAPAGSGSFDGKTEKLRKDNSKDAWATAVLKIQVHGNKQELVLLDGAGSRAWTGADGFEEIAEYARYWGTNLAGYEATGQTIPLYEEFFRDAARRVGARLTPIKLAWTYSGKRNYFEHLATKAKRGEFVIVEPTPGFQRDVHAYKEFLDEFLQQATAMRFVSGRPAVLFDDHFNVVAFGTDPELQRYAPKPNLISPIERIDAGWDEETYRRRSRYCVI